MSNTKTYYILVADSSAATLFRSQDGLKRLEVVHEQHNPAGRKMRAELETDRPGQQRNDSGGMHGLGGDDDAHRHACDSFARELCHLLHKEHELGNFSDLLIAAPPHLLGDLRHHLSPDCAKVLRQSVNKDLLRARTSEIIAHFS